MRAAVDQMVQTATTVLKGQLTPREAVTIFATLTRDALPAARELRATDPERADTCRALILAIGRELRRTEQDSDEPRHLRALTDDLARVLRELG